MKRTSSKQALKAAAAGNAPTSPTPVVSPSTSTSSFTNNNNKQSTTTSSSSFRVKKTSSGTTNHPSNNTDTQQLQKKKTKGQKTTTTKRRHSLSASSSGTNTPRGREEGNDDDDDTFGEDHVSGHTTTSGRSFAASSNVSTSSHKSSGRGTSASSNLSSRKASFTLNNNNNASSLSSSKMKKRSGSNKMKKTNKKAVTTTITSGTRQQPPKTSPLVCDTNNDEDPFASIKPLDTTTTTTREKKNDNDDDAKDDQQKQAVLPSTTTTTEESNNKNSSSISLSSHPFQRGGPHGVSQSSTIHPMFPDKTRLFRILDGDRLLFYNDTPNTDFVIRIQFLGRTADEDYDHNLEFGILEEKNENKKENEQLEEGNNRNNSNDDEATIVRKIIPERIVQEVEPRGSAKWHCEAGVKFDFTPPAPEPTSSSTTENQKQNHKQPTSSSSSSLLPKAIQLAKHQHFIIDIIQPGETSVFAQGKGVAKGFSMIFGFRSHARTDPTAEPLSVDHDKYQLPVLKNLLLNNNKETSEETTTTSSSSTIIKFSSPASTKVYPVFPDATRLFRVHDSTTGKLYFYNDTKDRQFFIRADFEEASTSRPIKLLGSTMRSAREPGFCTDYILPGKVQPFVQGEFLMSHFTVFVLELKVAEKSAEVICNIDDDDEDHHQKSSSGNNETGESSSNNNNHNMMMKEFKFNVTPEGWDRTLLHHHKSKDQHHNSNNNVSEHGNNSNNSSHHHQFPRPPRFVSVFPIIFGKLYRIHDGDRTLLYNDTKDENFEVVCEFPQQSHVAPIGNAIKKKQQPTQQQQSSKTTTAGSAISNKNENTSSSSSSSIIITDVVFNTKTQPFCKGDVSQQSITVISHKIEATEEDKQKRLEQQQQQQNQTVIGEHKKTEKDPSSSSNTLEANKENTNDYDDENTKNSQKNAKLLLEEEKSRLRRAPAELVDAAAFNFNGVGPMHLNDTSRVFSMFEDNSKFFRVIDQKNKMLYFYNDTDNFEFIVKLQFKIPKLQKKKKPENEVLNEKKRVGFGGGGRRRVVIEDDRMNADNSDYDANDADDDYTKLLKSAKKIHPSGTAVVIDDPVANKKFGSLYHVLTILDTIPPLTTHCVAENVCFALFHRNATNSSDFDLQQIVVSDQATNDNNSIINSKLLLPCGYKVSFAQRVKQLATTSNKNKTSAIKSSTSTSKTGGVDDDDDQLPSSAFEASVKGLSNARQGRRHSTKMSDKNLAASSSSSANASSQQQQNQAQLQAPMHIKRFNLSGPFGITMSSKFDPDNNDNNNTSSRTKDGGDDENNSSLSSLSFSSKEDENDDESTNTKQLSSGGSLRRRKKSSRRSDTHDEIPCKEFLTFDCFDGDGMLFRIVTLPGLNKWYFYNDTVDAEMHVNVKFFGAKNLKKPPNSTASIVHSSDRKGDIDLVTDIILPGETNVFVEADEISKFSCNFSAKSVTALNRKKMKESGAPLVAQDRRKFAELTYDITATNDNNNNNNNNNINNEEGIELCVEQWVSFIDTAFPPTEFSIFRPTTDHSDPGFVSWIRATNLVVAATSSKAPGDSDSSNIIKDNSSPEKITAAASSSSASLVRSSSSTALLSRKNSSFRLRGGVSGNNQSQNHNHQQQQQLQLTNGMNFIAPHFVRDSAVGNQWLSCAIAILAEFPDFVRDVFNCAALRDLTRRRTEQKLGVHRICYVDSKQLSGEWWTSSDVVDDFLPCVGIRSLCCIRHRTRPARELWVSLIEKMFAKLTGSYSAVLGGDPLFVFGTVTGFPCSRFEEKDFKEAKENDKRQMQHQNHQPESPLEQRRRSSVVLLAINSNKNNNNSSSNAIKINNTTSVDHGQQKEHLVAPSPNSLTTSTIFSSLLDASRTGNIVMFSTKSTYFLSDAVIAVEEQNLRDSGLELDRSYAIVDMRHFPEYDDLRLVQVRNVWYYYDQQQQQNDNTENNQEGSAGFKSGTTTGRDVVGTSRSSNNSKSGRQRRKSFGMSARGGSARSARSISGNQYKNLTTSSAAFEFDPEKNNNDDLIFEDEEDELTLLENDPDLMIRDAGWKGQWSPSDKQWSRLSSVAKACAVDMIYPGATTSTSSANNLLTSSGGISTIADDSHQTTTPTSTPVKKKKPLTFLEQQQLEKEQQLEKAEQLRSNKHSFWIEWRDLLKFIHSAGICFSSRLWSNYRIRSSFGVHDGTSPIAFKVRCKPSMQTPVSVVFSINQAGLPPLAAEARGGRPYLSVSLMMLHQQQGSSKYSVKLVSSKVINLPTYVYGNYGTGDNDEKTIRDDNNKSKKKELSGSASLLSGHSRLSGLIPERKPSDPSPIEHYSAKHVGFKYEFIPPISSANNNNTTNNNSDYFYIIPHCDIVLPSDDVKTLSFSLCYYAETQMNLLNSNNNNSSSDHQNQQSNNNSSNKSANSSSSNNLEVQFVQIQQTEKWFEDPMNAHDVIATPVDEDYQFKKSGSKPVARHGWTFDVPS